MKTIHDIDVKDKIILVRTDYNVPLDDGNVTSDFRIRASFPTLEFLQQEGAEKIIIISHLGRPDGKDKKLSLAPVAEVLKNNFPAVDFAANLTDVPAKLAKLPRGGILLLENLRFDPREKANDATLMQEIVTATHADLYVQDAFAVLHRAHASTTAISEILPVYAGLLVEKEVENLDKVMLDPDHPLVVIIGGAKVADKTPLIQAFTNTADHILVGGKIAADGYQPENNRNKISVAEDFDTDSAGVRLDIGPLSTAEFANATTDAKTIIWNGLLGKAEDPAYATASTIVAELLGEKRDATTIICGGDTTAFVEEIMKEHPTLSYTLISTGGGATLEYLTGAPLPGLTPLQ